MRFRLGWIMLSVFFLFERRIDYTELGRDFFFFGFHSFMRKKNKLGFFGIDRFADV